MLRSAASAVVLSLALRHGAIPSVMIGWIRDNTGPQERTEEPLNYKNERELQIFIPMKSIGAKLIEQ